MAAKGKPEPKKKKTTPASPKAKAAPKSKTPKTTVKPKPTNNATKATPAYDDLRPAPAPTLGNIPWGYGDNRVVAMARDPQMAFAYWEVTDDGIRAAQAKVNDPHAGLHLRVYDTTGREFDGLNAHLHWDHGVNRETNSFYIKAGKPGATITVDIGVMNGRGEFFPIARSGPCEMPRESMSRNGVVEATTVLRSSPGYTYRHRYVAPPTPPAPPESPIFEAAHPAESEKFMQHLTGEGWTRNEWTETQVDGRIVRWIRWSGPIAAEALKLLPVAGAPWRTIEVLFQGERRVVKTSGGEQVVYGPWRMTLEAVGPQGERKTVEQWMIKRRWTTVEGMIRVETPAVLTRVLGGRSITVLKSGSEARLATDSWGSQQLAIGASEWRWIGASENLLMGSSELLQAGGSEMIFLGASETFELGGASEGKP